MDYQAELRKINDKYYPIIKEKYGKYIRDFDSIPDMTQNIEIVPDKNCYGKLSDLKNTREKFVKELGICLIS